MEKHTDRRALPVLKAYNFAMYGSFAILFTFFPIYFSQQGLGKIEIGLIMAGGPFISILANPFWGYISDKYQNIKRTLIILLIGNLIVAQFIFHIDIFVILFVIMLIFFFFNSPLNSQGNSMILNAIEGTKHKFGAFRLWGSLGYALVALAAGPILVVIGLERLWILYTFLVVLTLLFAFRLPGSSKLSAATVVVSRQGYGQIFKNRTFLIFVLLGVLISVPNAMNSTFVSIYIQDLGGTSVAIGWSAFIGAIFEVFIFLLLDRFVKRETRFIIACLIAVSALFTLRWGLMSIATEPLHILFIQALHCLTFGGYYYLGTTLTALLIPYEYRASGQAAFALTWGGISGIIAGFSGGWIYESLGPVAMYRSSTLIAFLGMIGFIFLMLRLRKQARPEIQGNE